MTMLTSKAKRELKRDQRRILIDSIEMRLLSPHQIRAWGERQLPNGKRVGQVKNSKTVNYKRFTPLRDGLFCERIFGPVTSFVCACGKRQPRSEARFCERCEVEYTDQRARRYRLGFISLVSPAVHVWYLKGRPSYLPLFLGKRKKGVVALSYCNAYLVEQAASSVQVFPHLAKRQDHGISLFSRLIRSKTQTNKLSERFEMLLASQASHSRHPVRGQGRAQLARAPREEKRHTIAANPTPLAQEHALERQELRGSQITSFYRFLAEVLASNTSRPLAASREAKSRFSPVYKAKDLSNKPLDLAPALASTSRSGAPRGVASEQEKGRSQPEIRGAQEKDSHGRAIEKGDDLSASLQLFSNVVVSSQQASSDLYPRRVHKQQEGTRESSNTSRLDASRGKASKALNSTRLALHGDVPEKRMRRGALHASFQSEQAVARMYNRAHSLPLLPTLICKYNLRDELLNLLDSSPATGDVPIPTYCQTKRWQPLRDVHKFMAEQPFYQRDDILSIEDRIGDMNLSDEGAAYSAAPSAATQSGQSVPNLPCDWSTGLGAAFKRRSAPPALFVGAISPTRGVKRLYSVGFANQAPHSYGRRQRLGKQHNPLTISCQEQIRLCAKRLLYSVYKPCLKRDRGEKRSTHLRPEVQPINGQLLPGSYPFERDQQLYTWREAHEDKKGLSPSSSIWLRGALSGSQDDVLSPFLIPPRTMRSQGIKEVALSGSANLEHTSHGHKQLTPVWGRRDAPSQDNKPIAQAHLPSYADRGRPAANQDARLSATATTSRKPLPKGALDQRAFVVPPGLFKTPVDGQSQDEMGSSNAELSEQKVTLINTYTSGHKPLSESLVVREGSSITVGARPHSNHDRLIAKDPALSPGSGQLDAALVGGRQRRGSRRDTDLLSPLEFVTIREILSYTGGGALDTLLKRFHTQLFSTFLLAEVQTARDAYKRRASLLGSRPSRGERRILARVCRRISRNARRLKLSQLLSRSQRRPEWMTISSLPVLPPDLRPILQMSESLVVASDLNNLYQRVIYRNNRYHKLRFIDFHLVTAIQRLVQDAVDRLIENGKGGSQPFYTPSGRPLKSLSDTLKGKKGRFRLNLLGKRVDFSGRSVIVVSPDLRIHECGLPRAIALELYHYFLLRCLMVKREAYSIVVAKRLIKQQEPAVWDMLRDIIYHHPLLLNRAPTLHRLGIQAFQPKLVLGNAILLHPLVCSGFNADFDGDQMGVHLPLSPQARAEAWDLLWSRNNLLSPATGQPVLMPSQDMVLGFYYMTQMFTNRSLAPRDPTSSRHVPLPKGAPPPHKIAMRRISNEGIADLIEDNESKRAENPTSLLDQKGLSPQPQRQDRLTIARGRDQGVGRRGTDKHALSGSLRGKHLPRAVQWQVPQSNKLFLTQDGLIHAFQTRCIGLHTPVWLRCDIAVESGEGASGEAPLELRVTSFGGDLQIYSQHRRGSHVIASPSTMYIRTTAGRVLVNAILADSKTPAP